VAFGRGIAAKSLQLSLKDLRISKPFLVTGRSGFDRYRASLLAGSGMCSADGDASDVPRYAVSGEPTVEDCLAATAAAKQAGCDGVVAIGGGSALDLGKVSHAVVCMLDWDESVKFSLWMLVHWYFVDQAMTIVRFGGCLGFKFSVSFSFSFSLLDSYNTDL
jgi:alcohol dehydrogenase class IV